MLVFRRGAGGVGKPAAFLIGLGTLIVLRGPHGSVFDFVLAFLISPYGIPLFLDWVVDKLDDLEFAIQNI